MRSTGATVFSYPVEDLERYGVVELGDGGRMLSLKERPTHRKSHYAVTGLWYNSRVADYARNLKPSARGKFEFTDPSRCYLDAGDLYVEQIGCGYA